MIPPPRTHCQYLEFVQTRRAAFEIKVPHDAPPCGVSFATPIARGLAPNSRAMRGSPKSSIPKGSEMRNTLRRSRRRIMEDCCASTAATGSPGMVVIVVSVASAKELLPLLLDDNPATGNGG